MTFLKQTYLMHTDEVEPREMKAIEDGIKQACTIAGLKSNLKNLGAWYSSDFIEDRRLRAGGSVFYYIEEGIGESEIDEQLNGNTIMRLLKEKPIMNKRKGYTIIVTEREVYREKVDGSIAEQVGGLAMNGVGAIISTYPFSEIETAKQYECLKSEAVKRFSWVLGLPKEKSLENRLGIIGYQPNQLPSRMPARPETP